MSTPSSNSSTTVPQAAPNPMTPMAFLPPELAYQVTVLIYVFVGSLAVLVWDILNNLRGDYRLLTKYHIGAPTIVYFISRVTCLTHVLGAVTFSTAPTGHCEHFEKALDWIYPFAMSSTALLFFFRVRAVFDRNKVIVGFFALMWLAVVAGCLTTTQGITGAHIGPTNYCITSAMASWVTVAAIIPLVNDTLVFLAISWRVMGNAMIERSNIRTGIRVLAFGDYMPSLSKALLQDGQAYYLTTVITGLLTVIMQYVRIPVVYRTMFTVPNMVLMNIMACRVYRNIKFSLFRETGSTTTSDSMAGSLRWREDKTGDRATLDPLESRIIPCQPFRSASSNGMSSMTQAAELKAREGWRCEKCHYEGTSESGEQARSSSPPDVRDIV